MHQLSILMTNLKHGKENPRPFRPQISTRPSKLIRLTRPEKLTPASESRDVVFPEVAEPTERSADLRTPKALDQSRPTENVRPGLVFRPTNPRKLNEPEPKTEVIEEETEEHPKSGRPSFRPLQPRTPVQSKSNEPELNPSQTKQTDRVRPRLLVRKEGHREVTEEPEPDSATEETQKGPKLVRPKIKVFRPGKKDSTNSDSALQSEKVLDQEVADSILNQQTVDKEVSADRLKSKNVENEPTKLLATTQNKDQTSSTETTNKGRVAPIRRIKLIRNREPNKSVQSQRSGEVTRESETPEIQQTTTKTTTDAPKRRLQASNRRTTVTQDTQEVTTFRPRVTAARTTGSTQAAQRRSRGQTGVTQETSGGSTRGRTRGSSRSRTTQEPSGGRNTATRGRSRSRSRVTTEPTVTTVTIKSKEPIEKDILKQEPTKIQTTTTENTKTLEVTETSTEPLLPVVEAKSTMKPIEGEEKNASGSEQPVPDNIKEVDNVATTEATPNLKDQPMKKTTLLKPQVLDEQGKDEEVIANIPEEISQTEQSLTTKEVTDKPLVIQQSKESEPSSRPSPQPHEVTRLSPKIQESTTKIPTTQVAGRQRSTTQAESRQRSTTQAESQQRSTTQAANRQRSSTQTASRRRSDSTSAQTTSRSRSSSRGRLTARQRLAVAN